MEKQVLFFQGGGGREDHQEDAKMVASLASALGKQYRVHYPFLDNEQVPDFGRSRQIAQELAAIEEPVMLVGHSLGASMLLKYFSENHVTKRVGGIFLMATPFWTGNEDWVKPLKLSPNFAEKLSRETPLIFYHCRDDEVVPFAQLAMYKKALPWATFNELPTGGHQFDKGLDMVAKDIASLQKK